MSFAKSMEYLDWKPLAACVLEVFMDNQSQERENGILASSDVWATNTTLRSKVWKLACSAWCRRTGLDHTYFPLSEDAVARLYFRYRKRNADEIKAFRDEIES